jgi:predicted nucleic acid-binding protein
VIYTDSSALVKRYVSEPDSAQAVELLRTDPAWITGQHTFTEVSIALARRTTLVAYTEAMDAFEADWLRMNVVAIDDHVCRRAARIGAELGIRTLDALHMAAAERAGNRSVPIATFDTRFAEAARRLGFTVLGA